MANAANKVKEVFISANKPLTLTQIKELQPSLHGSEVSMALCYLRRQRWLTREKIDNPNEGRNTVWLYRYHPQRLDTVETFHNKD